MKVKVIFVLFVGSLLLDVSGMNRHTRRNARDLAAAPVTKKKITRRQDHDPAVDGRRKQTAMDYVRRCVFTDYYQDAAARKYLSQVLRGDGRIWELANLLYEVANELYRSGERLDKKLGAPPQNDRKLFDWIANNFNNGTIDDILQRIKSANLGIVYDSEADYDRDTLLLNYENLGGWRLIQLPKKEEKCSEVPFIPSCEFSDEDSDSLKEPFEDLMGHDDRSEESSVFGEKITTPEEEAVREETPILDEQPSVFEEKITIPEEEAIQEETPVPDEQPVIQVEPVVSKAAVPFGGWRSSIVRGIKYVGSWLYDFLRRHFVL